MDKVKRIQELRRSNAATPMRNKKKYNRKEKYKNKLDNQIILGAALVKSTRRLRRVIYISGNYPYLTRQVSVPYDIIPLSTTRKGLK